MKCVSLTSYILSILGFGFYLNESIAPRLVFGFLLHQPPVIYRMFDKLMLVDKYVIDWTLHLIWKKKEKFGNFGRGFGLKTVTLDVQ